jgi:putative DNA primase/helicase
MKLKTDQIAELTAELNTLKSSRIANAIQNARAEPLATTNNGEIFYTFCGKYWQQINYKTLAKEVTKLFMDCSIDVEPRHVNNIISMLRWISPEYSDNTNGKLFFSDGVLDKDFFNFEAHNKCFGNTGTLEFNYLEEDDKEYLWNNCPFFSTWLNNMVFNGQPKEHVLAALYMVLFNRYDWQLFLEITGKPNSGKSTFSKLCTHLVGTEQWESGDISNLEDPRERALIAGKRLIILPDLQQYRGPARGLCKITGNDTVPIDPKYLSPFSQPINAIIVITNNLPMVIEDKTGAVDRRRVTISCNHPIHKDNVDVKYFTKIKKELPYIAKLLISIFPNPENARNLLIKQRDSKVAFEAVYKDDSFWQFCLCLDVFETATGMYIGQDRASSHRSLEWNPERFLYHAYIDFLDSHSHGQKNKVGITSFSNNLEKYLNMMNYSFIKKRVAAGNITNLKFNKELQFDLQ